MSAGTWRCRKMSFLRGSISIVHQFPEKKKKIRCERPKEMSGRFIAFVSGRQLKRLMTAIVGSSDLPAALVPVGAGPWNSRPVVCGCVKLDIEPLCCCPLSGAGNQMFWPIGAPSKKNLLHDASAVIDWPHYFVDVFSGPLCVAMSSMWGACSQLSAAWCLRASGNTFSC